MNLGARRAKGKAVAVLAMVFCIQAAAAQAAPDPAPFLWHVDGPHATHYLLGAVHLLPARADDLPKALEQAYAQADGVVFETDIGALAMRDVQVAFAAAGHSKRPLAGRVGKALYGRVAKRAVALDMPLSLCRYARAWSCAVDLGVYAFRQAGFSLAHGIDTHFYDEAVADGKTVNWFEPVKRHLALFTRMNEKLGRTMLVAALARSNEGPNGGLASPRALYTAWLEGDINAVARFDRHFKQHYPTLYARLVGQRNRQWMPQLRALLDGTQPQLVVVGAAHMVGPDGLVSALRKAGYRVAPGLAAAPLRMHVARSLPPP